MIELLNAIIIAVLTDLQQVGFNAKCLGLAWFDESNQVVGENAEGALTYAGLDDALTASCYIRSLSDIELQASNIGACRKIQGASITLRLVVWKSEEEATMRKKGLLESAALSALHNFNHPNTSLVYDVRLMPQSILLSRESIVEQEMNGVPTFNPQTPFAAIDFELSFKFNPCALDNKTICQ